MKAKLVAFLACLATILALIVPSQRAAADVITTFELVNVNFGCVSCPQTGTGTFKFNSTTNTILSASILTTGPDPGIGLGYVPPEYTSGSFSNQGSQYWFVFDNGGVSTLVLATSSSLSLTSSNPLISLLSGNEGGWTGVCPTCFAGWSRGMGGSINPVPLPAALPLFASGLVGLGWLARRKRRGLAAAT